jgi:hypothetical protein
MHQAVWKIKYAIKEARRKKGGIYLAYLDWFGVFCSVPIQQMFLVLERMGLAQPDVDLLRGMFADQWLQVDTPFGKTVRVSLEQGTQQGDPLSLLLFIIFLNLCLRHVLDAGVGVTHAAMDENRARFRQNHAAFAEDIVLAA